MLCQIQVKYFTVRLRVNPATVAISRLKNRTKTFSNIEQLNTHFNSPQRYNKWRHVVLERKWASIKPSNSMMESEIEIILSALLKKENYPWNKCLIF